MGQSRSHVATIDTNGCSIGSVQRQAKLRVWDFLAPIIAGVGFLFRVVYFALFGWWLDPWLQRKSNRALREDVHANFSFLTSRNQVSISHPRGVLPFNYASAEIRWENVLITITRGRSDTTVTVAPRSAPQNSYELGPLIAALEQRHLSERDIVYDLVGAANLMRPRLEALNHAFSENELQHTKQLL
jgi:hypothetical protein